MELCVMIEGQEDVSWSHWLAVAAACEEHGVPALFRSDHYLPLDQPVGSVVLDAWGTVCALAATTTTVRLGTLVSPVTFRHPAVLAKLAATADHISQGRVEVGLGTGWHAGEHTAFGFRFGSNRERFDVLLEQLEVIMGLWSGEAFAHRGERYVVEGVAGVGPLPKGPMPLIIGGSAGRRSADLAARFAAEYNTGYVTPAAVRDRREVMRRACERADRDPATLRFSVMTGFAAGTDSRGANARVERLAARRGIPDFTPPQTWISGTLEEASEQLSALRDEGVDRVMLQLFLHDELDQIELIGRDLAPRVA